MAGEDPLISGMAGRYAGALFELALESKATEPVKSDLDRFDAMIAGAVARHAEASALRWSSVLASSSR